MPTTWHGFSGAVGFFDHDRGDALRKAGEAHRVCAELEPGKKVEGGKEASVKLA
jgi:hypothetical protein